MLALVVRQELSAPMLESCLPSAEFALRADGRGLALLRGLDRTAYRSAMDFLYALLVPPHKPQVLAYYAEKGLPLRELYGERSIQRLDMAMARNVASLNALHRALYGAGRAESAEATLGWLEFTARPSVAPSTWR